MAAIPIGGDEADYKALRSQDGSSVLAKHCFNLSYVGTIWPPVVETAQTLLRAIRRLREQIPVIYRQLRLNFIGTTANPNDTTRYRVLPLAEAEGVADIVHEVPQRLPYLEALAIQAHSDAILMLGSDEAHYTASKIFGVLMSGRPYLSVFHTASSAHDILVRAGGGAALSFSSRNELVALEEPLVTAIAKLVAEPKSFGRVDPVSYAAYTAAAIARQYATIFDHLVAREKIAV